jgi:hypothetical protein
MRMRKALATLLVTLLTSTAVAQTPAKPARIGKLCPAKCDGFAHIIFEEELRKLGWIEGKNLITERKEAEGRFERLPDPCGPIRGLQTRCHRRVKHAPCSSGQERHIGDPHCLLGRR